MRIAVFGPACALLLFAAAGCGSDLHTPPITGGPPPPPPPPPAQSSLWTASGTTAAILRLAPEQLQGTGDRTPATAVTTPSALVGLLAGLAFDARGSMWITSSDDNRLISLAPGALDSSGSRTATTVIAPPVLRVPVALAFDRQHRLWVANFGNGTLVRFDAPQLLPGGDPSPAVVVSGAGTPASLAFDADGSLWVSDNQLQTISKYTEAQLTASGSPVPAVVLRSTGNSAFAPLGLAFDVAGNLWVANLGSANVVAFSPAQLATSGSPEPHIVLSTPRERGAPLGLAFDQEGSLWVVGGSGLTKFAAASLGASGAPAPSGVITLAGHSLFWSAAFWPRPPGLPLN
jgi:sugar lactone lactonase YvrE